MELQVEAVYENGTLKVEQPLPLAEGQRVQVVVRVKTSRVKRAYGLLRWTGDPEVLRKIALDPEFSPEEAP
jgi:predicted DNA-binding antitoxin AbrB/MazE fold protein